MIAIVVVSRNTPLDCVTLDDVVVFEQIVFFFLIHQIVVDLKILTKTLKHKNRQVYRQSTSCHRNMIRKYAVFIS